MRQNRRDFLRSTGLMAAAALAGRCAADAKVTGGGSMSGYAAPALGPKVRVGVVGIGGRGSYAVHRLCTVPGIEVTALCDLVEEKALKEQKWMKAQGFGEPKVFTGPEGYKRLCESGLCDVVHNNTDWSGHVPVSMYAMQSGLHACVEVPGCLTVDECWNLVEASEKTRRHCIMLENCCYGEHEMLLLNLAQKGVLGEIIYGEGGYVHDGRWTIVPSAPWRLKRYGARTGMDYPTHGLGPVALAMDVNRGDRFDMLVSMGTDAFARRDYAERKYGKDHALAKLNYVYNDVNYCLVKTAKGKTIMLKQYGAGPHPYTRMNELAGTKGAAGTYPLRVLIEDQKTQLGREHKDWADPKTLEAIRKEYMHPLWKQAGEIARVSGGHGGMDFMMDLRWAYCLQNGLPVDMDVYDLAAWSSIVELSNTSVRNRSREMDVPDFTRGGWKKAPHVGDMSIDVNKMKLDMDKVRKTGRQQTV